MKILEQLADLLSGVDEEVLPALMKSLEPILPLLISQSQLNNIDLAQVIGVVSQTLQKSTFHASLSTHLGDLDFINLGMTFSDKLHGSYRPDIYELLNSTSSSGSS